MPHASYTCPSMQAVNILQAVNSQNKLIFTVTWQSMPNEIESLFPYMTYWSTLNLTLIAREKLPVNCITIELHNRSAHILSPSQGCLSLHATKRKPCVVMLLREITISSMHLIMQHGGILHTKSLTHFRATWHFLDQIAHKTILGVTGTFQANRTTTISTS